MTLFLERKYILALVNRFDGWTAKSAKLWNARCIFCGDSKDKRRKRFYIYQRDNHFWAHCHNCGYHSGIRNLLKKLDYRLYQEYELETFTSNREHDDAIHEEKVAIQYNADAPTQALRTLQKISQLPADHPAKRYVVARAIPNPLHTIIRWSPAFMEWTNRIIKDKFSERELKLDHGRIIIPFFSERNKFFAYIGRSIDNSKPRYILIILDHSVPLIYGMNHIDTRQRIYVLEGPIDTFFLANSVAMGGSNISVLTNLEKYDIVVVIDNEPHKADTVKKVEHAINLGHKVCIWPRWMVPKDINAMVLEGMSSEYLTKLIDHHTYQGFEAKIKLAEWSRT